MALRVPHALRHRLDDLKITQADVARELELDVSVISLWCQGKRAVPANRLDRLAEILQFSVADLLHLEALMGVDAAPLAPLGKPVEVGPRPSFVPPPEAPAEFVDIPRPPLDPYPLRWCTSTHGTGIKRRHHHGYLPPWGPPGPLP